MEGIHVAGRLVSAHVRRWKSVFVDEESGGGHAGGVPA